MQSIDYKTNVRFRSDLFTLLSEACELEHGLACSYLFTAFSLKQSVSEGLSASELLTVKKWAATIFFIASQEMLHLAQAWNLLNAIGGTPYYYRPNFPQPSKYYPFHLPLSLEPFSYETIQRFILYELPSEINEKEFAKQTFGFESEDNFSYKTVGELYRLIQEGFSSIDETTLFIGNPSLQMGPDEIDFREIIKVTDRQSALAAIELITHQGEGTMADRLDCHHGLFVGIEQEYIRLLQDNPSFQPARNCLTNPITFRKGNYASKAGQLIQNPLTREISDIFDDLYNLMIRVIQYSFTCIDQEIRRHMSEFAINLMVRTIKPLGEYLTTQPAFSNPYFKTAGATFSLTRHVPLPEDYEITNRIVTERSHEIYARLTEIATEVAPRNQFREIVANYRDMLLSSFPE